MMVPVSVRLFEPAGTAEPAATPTPVGLASPKSSTLTRPSARTIMLSGLKSRWTMPA